MAKFFWDCWCVISVVGIWPRFIEPRILSNSYLRVIDPNFHSDLEDLKIILFSDLHLLRNNSKRFLKKLACSINRKEPDIILFAGDFLSHSRFYSKKVLLDFLCELEASVGCYCVLGNHDYSSYVSVNAKGDYDLVHDDRHEILKGFDKLFSKTQLTGRHTEATQNLKGQSDLLEVLEESPFQLLNNETVQVQYKDSYLNITGLGEWMTGQCNPKQAFSSYNNDYPGITLVHNPDAIPSLDSYPGNLILCGHTHGGQVNVPYLRSKFITLENPKYRHGLYKVKDKYAFISRGVGGTFSFRWFAPPELVNINLSQNIEPAIESDDE